MSTSRGSSFSNLSRTAFRCYICKMDLPTECYCHLPVVILRSKTETNPGRRFLSCPARVDQQCSFFIWYDKPTNEAHVSVIEALREQVKAYRIEVEASLVSVEAYERKLQQSKRRTLVAWLLTLAILLMWIYS